DGRLRVGALGAEPVEDLLRAHVQPLDIDLGVERLEPLLEGTQQVGAVRGIDDQRLPAVRRRACGGDREQESRHNPAGATPARCPGRTVAPGTAVHSRTTAGVEEIAHLCAPRARRLATRRYAPATPAGSCRKSARPV